jgi:hypothetical protein
MLDLFFLDVKRTNFKASFSFDPSSANAIRIGMNGIYLVRAPSLGRTHITANEHCRQEIS